MGTALRTASRQASMMATYAVPSQELRWMQEHSEPDRSGHVQCSGYGMPGAVVVLKFVDTLFST